MGAGFRFSCRTCGYQADVSGGLNFGMMSVTHTVSCPRCRELSDLPVSEKPWEIMGTPLARGDEGETVQAVWMAKRISCGRDRRHTAQLWSHPGPCPRCGETLVQGERTAFWE